jgi:hypothetical protein
MRDWKQRNRVVELAMRDYLASVPRAQVLATSFLAGKLHEILANDDLDASKISSILTKLAPWMGKLATHDGEVFEAFGRINRRWRWHGQSEVIT